MGGFSGPELVLPPDGPGSCPNDTEWQAMGSHCYLFQPDEMMSWQDARARCRGYGADLVTSEDMMENMYVAEEAFSAQNLPLEKSFWIGLRRVDPSKYIWHGVLLQTCSDVTKICYTKFMVEKSIAHH